MLKKYISKFTIDILPSIIATIVGAYIVNHYIVPKAGADKPAAAMAAVPTDSPLDAKVDGKPGRPVEKSADLGSASEPTVAKAKGGDKPVAEKPVVDKPETANVPERRHQPTREKAVAKVAPAPVTPAAVAPALATVGTAPTAEPSADDKRDANDLARAAIERLNRSEPRSQDAARVTEPARTEPRVQEASRTAAAPSLQQLPPPIVVASPNHDVGLAQPPYMPERTTARGPRPPGEIPAPLPVDLQADVTGASRDRTNVAEDVLSAAKSVFHSVIPRQFER